MSDADLMDRVAELERRAQRLVLAGDDRGGGWGAWQNLLEIRLMQERDYFNDLLTEIVARLQPCASGTQRAETQFCRNWRAECRLLLRPRQSIEAIHAGLFR